MTDERYLAFETTRERASVARSARKRKTHNGKGGCKLPHESDSLKENQAKNGPVVVYKMGVPIRWEEFKCYPKDIQERYLREIQKRFDPPIAVVNRELFGKATGTLTKHLDKHGIQARFNSHQGHTWNGENRKKWDEWLGKLAPETSTIQKGKMKKEDTEMGETTYTTINGVPELVLTTSDQNGTGGFTSGYVAVQEDLRTAEMKVDLSGDINPNVVLAVVSCLLQTPEAGCFSITIRKK